ARMTRVHEFTQQHHVAKMLVHREVVDNVVFMVAGALENRRKIERGDAEVAQVIQLVEDALQIAAREVAEGGRRAPWFGSERVIRPVAVAEALRKNLV